jgi:hypothetical protein
MKEVDDRLVATPAVEKSRLEVHPTGDRLDGDEQPN